MKGRALSVLDWLEQQETVKPNTIAIRDVAHELTYSELALRAREIACSITIKECNAVVLYMEKSVDCYASMLGTLYAGCFYSVLDTELPDRRLSQICDLLHAQIVITDQVLAERAREIFGPMGAAVLIVDDLIHRDIQASFLTERRAGMCDSDPMYCNFTSGSTGSPKGVLISHRSVMDFIPEFCDVMQLHADDVFANQAPFDFDVSVKDLYSGLYLGAEVVLIPRAYFVDPMRLMDYLIETHVSVLVWAVSAMIFVSTMKGFRYRVPYEIRKIIFSGEVMPLKHLQIWKSSLPQAEYVNVYGPTEITCNCTYYILQEEDFEKGDLPIGVPFYNERVFLLNEQGNLVTKADEEGEICVSGTCLAIGYIDKDGVTDAFVFNPANAVYKERIYRTGDKGMYRSDGKLYYLGRMDHQVKHLGHRIELAEIEKQCDGLEGVGRSGCIYQAEKRRIVLYYDGEASEQAVATGLQQVLPPYMLPSVVHRIDQMPINNHGKLDRKALANLL